MAAGPNRDVEAHNATQIGADNIAVDGYPNGSIEWDNNANGSLTHHAYLRVAKNDFKTYVNGEIILTYIASGGGWARNYGLYGYDGWTRPIQIKFCEAGRFDYKASSCLLISAEAALTGAIESGDIYARAEALMFIKVDEVKKAESSREVLAGTKDLDHDTEPDVVSGPYSYGGKENGGQVKAKVAGDGASPAKAELNVTIAVPLTQKHGLDLKVQIHSWARLRVRVPTSYGWGRAKVKHSSYPGQDDGQLATKFHGTADPDHAPWSVEVTAWDMDDP